MKAPRGDMLGDFVILIAGLLLGFMLVALVVSWVTDTQRENELQALCKAEGHSDFECLALRRNGHFPTARE